jgi:hypothetical protein
MRHRCVAIESVREVVSQMSVDDRLFVESEALTMLAFILPFQSIPWNIGVPFIALVIGGIILKTKLAGRTQ